MNHGLRLAVLAKQIGVAIVRNVVCGGRRVDKQYVSGICKVEYAFHVLRVQLADFVHHAMYAEVAELTAYLSFEYIYQHDVYHCLNQCVRSLASHMRQLVHPSRVVVVLHDAELQQE